MKISIRGHMIEIVCSQPFIQKSLQDFLKLDVSIPKTLLHEIRMSKTVKVNEEEPNWLKPLNENDRITFKVIYDETITPPPTKMNIEILKEDENLLIINKPYGIDTHPSSESDTTSLSNGVAAYFQQQGIQQKVRHIHRLDRDTSGTILFAKHALSGAILDRSLERREIKRTYLALVEGIVKTKKGTINKSIGKDRHHSNRRVVAKTGQKAVTHFEVLEQFPKDNCTLVKLTLETGRTHQIRVHMSSIGNPLVGDQLYGAKTKNGGRHALHAWHITIPHPFDNTTLHAKAPIPESFCPPLLLKKIKSNFE